MPNIKPNEFQNYIISLLGKYSNEVVEKTVKEKVSNLGKEAKPELKSKMQPKPSGHLVLSGVYKKNWILRNLRKKGISQIKLYNKKKPTLVHLLEFGHKGPVGVPRGATRSPAYPHVREVELKYMKKLYEELRRELE